MMQTLAKHVFYPAWDLKERAGRLRELRALEASQYWPTERVANLQLQRLKAIVQHAQSTCQFYRDAHAAAGFSDTLQSLGDLKRLPVVSKRDLRERADAFMSSRFAKADLFEARTGGSTGKALIVFFDKACQEFRNAAAMRSDRWAGRDLGAKTVALWGNPPRDESLKARIRSVLLDRLLYVDTMALNEDAVTGFLTTWRSERPRVIYGHAHSIYVLAGLVQARGASDIRPLGIISTSMMLLDKERAVIEQVFGCRVSNRYGCEEVGLIAAECPEHRGMHLNAEHVIVECLKEDGTPARPGEEGEVVVTDLINYGMPLIRYRVEDVAIPSERVCVCGRTAPLLERVVGRVADFLVKGDGTLVAGVSLVERTLTRIAGIDQMRIVQETRDHITLQVVPGGGYTEPSRAALEQEFREVFGADVHIDLQVLPSLPQDASGKFRFSICKVMQL